jgi:hypothetical protein
MIMDKLARQSLCRVWTEVENNGRCVIQQQCKSNKELSAPPVWDFFKLLVSVCLDENRVIVMNPGKATARISTPDPRPH